VLTVKSLFGMHHHAQEPQNVGSVPTAALNVSYQQCIKPECVVHMQIRKLKRMISLEELKSLRIEHDALKDLQLFTTARLSVQNVSQEQWDFILSLEDKSP
jgi:predicted RNA-binding protein with PUA-like domain